jgi:hypothetical protein
MPCCSRKCLLYSGAATILSGAIFLTVGVVKLNSTVGDAVERHDKNHEAFRKEHGFRSTGSGNHDVPGGPSHDRPAGFDSPFNNNFNNRPSFLELSREADLPGKGGDIVIKEAGDIHDEATSAFWAMFFIWVGGICMKVGIILCICGCLSKDRSDEDDDEDDEHRDHRPRREVAVNYGAAHPVAHPVQHVNQGPAHSTSYGPSTMDSSHDMDLTE